MLRRCGFLQTLESSNHGLLSGNLAVEASLEFDGRKEGRGVESRQCEHRCGTTIGCAISFQKDHTFTTPVLHLSLSFFLSSSLILSLLLPTFLYPSPFSLLHSRTLFLLLITFSYSHTHDLTLSFYYPHPTIALQLSFLPLSYSITLTQILTPPPLTPP